MSGFFWNIRGFNKVSKHSVVKDWIKKFSLQFGCLLETRVKESRVDRVLTSVFADWSMTSNYEFNRLGRIWVIWSNKVKLTVVAKSGQMITCKISVEPYEVEFYVGFIYASNFMEERRDLWREIQTISVSSILRGQPWILCGDYNEILELDEHSRIMPSISLGTREFREVVRLCCLSDMGYHGPLFTWCNKRKDGLICKKLDRVLMNDDWSHRFVQSYCVFESGGCSDHLRGRILLTSEIARPKCPFKFTNVIASMPEFMPLVAEQWTGTAPLFQSTSALYRFSKKLKNLKPALRALSRCKLSDLSRRTTAAYDDLCTKQTSTLAAPNPQSIEEEACALERWEKLVDLEENFLKQKSRVHWMKVGDRNNKFFHNAVRERASQNAIKEILTPDGTRLTQQEDIKEEAVRFFSDFMKFKPPAFEGISVDQLQELLHYRCSNDDGDLLVREVSDAEVKRALFSLPSNKAPGPDGFTVEFFKETWSIVGTDFLMAVKSFFRFGFLPKGINSTILALIPKKNNAQTMKDFRPISCCHVLYKVISKIVANRLKRVLPEFIAPNQSAFIKDRLLMENLLLASELVKDYHKERVSSRCAMKIDISKAFDSVQWSFLLNVLAAINIPDKFIHWIRLCISSASFSVQINGELAGFFNSDRGLRQGCSLSPYLFVICMDVLSRMLNKAAANGGLVITQIVEICNSRTYVLLTTSWFFRMENSDLWRVFLRFFRSLRQFRVYASVLKNQPSSSQESPT